MSPEASVTKPKVQSGHRWSYLSDSAVAGWLFGRYSLDTAKEAEVLQLLDEAKANPELHAWVMSPSLSEHLVRDLRVDDSTQDKQRLEIIIAFQAYLSTRARSELMSFIGDQVSYASHPSYDEVSEKLLAILARFDASRLRSDEIVELSNSLLQQFENQKLKACAAWLLPLLQLYPVMTEEDQQRLQAAVATTLSHPTEPMHLPNFIVGLGEEGVKQLLQMPGIVQAIKTQPQSLEAFGVAKGVEFRKQFLEEFDPHLLIERPDIFDETRAWDLQLFLDTLRRAASDGLDTKDLRDALLNFVRTNLQPEMPAAKSLYEVTYELAVSEERLLDAAIGESLARCSVELLSVDPKAYYLHLRGLLPSLEPTVRQTLLVDVANRYLFKREAGWLTLLDLLSADLSSDPALATDAGLVKNLFELGFVAADTEPLVSVAVMQRLRPCLASGDLHSYVDRSLDKVLSYESIQKPVEEMLPFLRLLEASSESLWTSEVEKCSKFLGRMLEISKESSERIPVLRFMQDMHRMDLINSVRSELEDISASGVDSEEANLASALLASLSPST